MTGYPPILLIHGHKDSDVPFEEIDSHGLGKGIKKDITQSHKKRYKPFERAMEHGPTRRAKKMFAEVGELSELISKFILDIEKDGVII